VISLLPTHEITNHSDIEPQENRNYNFIRLRFSDGYTLNLQRQSEKKNSLPCQVQRAKAYTANPTNQLTKYPNNQSCGGKAGSASIINMKTTSHPHNLYSYISPKKFVSLFYNEMKVRFRIASRLTVREDYRICYQQK